MKIRTAAISDIEQLSNLFDNYRMFYDKESDLVAARDFLSERINLKESVIYVAEEDDQLLGFTQLYPIFSSTNLKRAFLLNDLFVAKNHRGKGISRKLIEKAQNLAKVNKMHGIMLETGKTNDVGNKLYPSCGFKLSNTSTNFYEWLNPIK